MIKYLVAIEPEFFPQYNSLPKEIKKKFKKQLTYLKDNPKHNSLQIHKLLLVQSSSIEPKHLACHDTNAKPSILFKT